MDSNCMKRHHSHVGTEVKVLQKCYQSCTGAWIQTLGPEACIHKRLEGRCNGKLATIQPRGVRYSLRAASELLFFQSTEITRVAGL